MEKIRYLLLSASLLATLSLANISAEEIADRSGYGYRQDNYPGSIQYQNYGDPNRDPYRNDSNVTNYGGYYGGAPYYGGGYYSGTPYVPTNYPGMPYGGAVYTPFPDSARSDAIYRSNQQLPR